MKAEDLKRALRAIIKEEVKKAVQEEVSRAMGKVLVEMVKEIKKPTKTITESEEPEEEVVMEESPIKTNNPKLNAVLTETARRFKPLQKTTDAAALSAMMEGDFEKVGANENAGITEPQPNFKADNKIDFLKSMVSPGVPSQPSVLGTSAVPDVLKGVFKKDFRAIMKKIDEQKKHGSPGMIDTSKLMAG